MKRYGLFIGRWRIFHDGHIWLVEQKLNEGIPALIAIRPTDEQPPLDVRHQQIVEALEPRGWVDGDDYAVMILPVDIESVNYGRGVGYDVNYHEPPDEIAAVSATKLLADPA